jgi:hypothetical protein
MISTPLVAAAPRKVGYVALAFSGDACFGW